MLNILILVSGNSETCNRSNFTFCVTEVLCSYMQLKILLQFRNFMINFIKILLQFASFKIHFMKIQLSYIILRKIYKNSERISQKDAFTQKHHKYRQILRYLCSIEIFLISEHF